WDEGLDVCVDLMGSSPLTQARMVDFVSGRAVIDAAHRKRFKYEAKSDFVKVFNEFIALVKTQHSTVIECFRCDLRGEYTFNDFVSLLKSDGTIYQTSCKDTSQQNSVAERKHHHLVEIARSFLLSADVPKPVETTPNTTPQTTTYTETIVDPPPSGRPKSNWMDWLSKYHAVIVCDEKLKGFHVLLAHIKEKSEEKSEKKRLEDMPVVRDFSEVFFEDFLGLSLTRKVKFQIDLVLGVAPVARVPDEVSFYTLFRENANPPPTNNLHILPTTLCARVVQELIELQTISTYVDSRLERINQFLNGFIQQLNEIDVDDLELDEESVDTPLVLPFLDTDGDSDNG
nr:Gag-Pol polyprotein [Tanacetum cinerariifolium]